MDEKLTKEKNGYRIWRCITVVGYELVREGNAIGKREIEGICRAGCIETRDKTQL